MFIEDLKNDFYNVLLGNRVLLLVHYDVDAVCTCKILQELFKCDNVTYTLVPVGGITELKTAYEENCEEIKFVVLINCGGTIDIVDVLQPEEDVIFFVLDSHKPTDVCNVYSDGQVRIVYKDRDENIPNFDDIFRDDEDQEDEIEPGREGLEAAMERRRERRAWEENRHTLMFNYTQFSYYGKPSALVCLELAQRLSRVTLEVTWAASVSGAASVELAARDRPAALLDADLLLRGLAAGVTGDVRVTVCEEPRLPLLRSVSLERALQTSPHVAPALTSHGHVVRAGERLRQLIAALGFPLSQARAPYRTMDVELRRSLLSSLQTAARAQSLPEVSHTTFLLESALTHPLPATDVVYVLAAMLDHESLPPAEGFQRALSSLTSCGPSELAVAARRLEEVATEAREGLGVGGAGKRGGPCVVLELREGSTLSGPLWLAAAGRWAAGAVKNARPVVVAVKSGAMVRLVGVPPARAGRTNNLFGAAFESAAGRSGVALSRDHFDTSYVSLPSSQLTTFLDSLMALLT